MKKSYNVLRYVTSALPFVFKKKRNSLEMRGAFPNNRVEVNYFGNISYEKALTRAAKMDGRGIAVGLKKDENGNYLKPFKVDFAIRATKLA